ncbi:MAG: hypothetical protein IPO08_23380 [Xanthomonadales bacterium]|nr:hypothetical protein [Xanthomonadales bacterium]
MTHGLRIASEQGDTACFDSLVCFCRESPGAGRYRIAASRLFILLIFIERPGILICWPAGQHRVCGVDVTQYKTVANCVNKIAKQL